MSQEKIKIRELTAQGKDHLLPVLALLEKAGDARCIILEVRKIGDVRAKDGEVVTEKVYRGVAHVIE